MPLKYYHSYINVRKVTTYPCMPFSRMENVTMLQLHSPSTGQKKTEKNMFAIISYFVVL